MEQKHFRRGIILVLIAGVFWGTMGIYVRTLNTYGFNSIQIASIRMTFAAVMFAAAALLKDRRAFCVRLMDVPLFLALGLLSVLFFTCCYFAAINRMSLSVAAILLYTSPIWVMLLSVLFFHNRFTGRKLLCLTLAFAGCVLVSGLGGSLSLSGFLFGLGSGIGYALYSIFGAVALKRYSPLTVTALTFLVASVGSWFIADVPEIIRICQGANSCLGLLLFLLLTAAASAFIPYLCYTVGMKDIGPDYAAIVATSEPIVAALLGIAAYREPISLMTIVGICCVLAAVILLSRQKENAD